MTKEKYIVGLDIGTTKICAACGVIDKFGQVNIKEIGTSSSRGISRGVVVDMEEAISSVQEAVENLEENIGASVYKVFANISGVHIENFKSHGVVTISDSENEITSRDIQRVISSARDIALPIDRKIIHMIPLGYGLDGQQNIKNPLGMYATKLEVELNIISGLLSPAQNLTKCVNSAGLEVESIGASSLVTSMGILTDEEKELGIVLVDMGGDLTEVLSFRQGLPWNMATIARGGNFITEGASDAMKIPKHNAEELKRRYAVLPATSVSQGEKVVVRTADGVKSIYRSDICSIFQNRVEELFSEINKKLKEWGGAESFKCGIAMTGGATQMDGVIELAEKYFNMPARMGYAKLTHGSLKTLTNPLYTTSIGLVLYGAAHRKKHKVTNALGNNILSRAILKVKELYSEYF